MKFSREWANVTKDEKYYFTQTSLILGICILFAKVLLVNSLILEDIRGENSEMTMLYYNLHYIYLFS